MFQSNHSKYMHFKMNIRLTGGAHIGHGWANAELIRKVVIRAEMMVAADCMF